MFPAGVRPFKCDTCPKAYFQKSDLERHIKLQHLQVTTIGENGVIQKPFRCMECPKSFAQSCDLERHIRTHAGIRPYKCEQVGGGYCKQAGYSGTLVGCGTAWIGRKFLVPRFSGPSRISGTAPLFLRSQNTVWLFCAVKYNLRI